MRSVDTYDESRDSSSSVSVVPRFRTRASVCPSCRRALRVVSPLSTPVIRSSRAVVEVQSVVPAAVVKKKNFCAAAAKVVSRASRVAK
ncbi:hypothetical protein JTE90_012060 [Oedothorax gibbosus]|uniref:Uncharacterized protein n=1 Tax=Oedothorax gibbosus TaxID=931172 RepID=A0AAV6TDU6_9ARAC|nr:hypothetical protein JTE90_012060 [Oedothorax gibbosus]